MEYYFRYWHFPLSTSFITFPFRKQDENEDCVDNGFCFGLIFKKKQKNTSKQLVTIVTTEEVVLFQVYRTQMNSILTLNPVMKKWYCEVNFHFSKNSHSNFNPKVQFFYLQEGFIRVGRTDSLIVLAMYKNWPYQKKKVIP